MLGTAIRYGIPLSFVYCTIYQQDIWREGDERLIQEQKRVWKDFFTMIDRAYNTATVKLSGSSTGDNTRLRITSMVESLDVRSGWNEKVMCAFSAVDKFISKPSESLTSISKKLGLDK